jgi:hypothetical protein
MSTQGSHVPKWHSTLWHSSLMMFNQHQVRTIDDLHDYIINARCTGILKE